MESIGPSHKGLAAQIVNAFVYSSYLQKGLSRRSCSLLRPSRSPFAGYIFALQLPPIPWAPHKDMGSSSRETGIAGFKKEQTCKRALDEHWCLESKKRLRLRPVPLFSGWQGHPTVLSSFKMFFCAFTRGTRVLDSFPFGDWGPKLGPARCKAPTSGSSV